jgi:hypothetical protein
MKRIYATCILGSAFLTLAIFSCSKNDKGNVPVTDEGKTVELTSAKVNTDALYDDVSMEVLQVNTDNGLSNQPTTVNQACATVTISPTDLAVWPKTVTIDYGTTGCTGLNGFVRKGKISYTLNKKLLQTGAVLTISFDNYSVNGYKLEGVYTITNNGSANGLNISVQLVNGKVTYPDGTWYTKTSNTTWVQSAGAGTLSYLDDEYDLTGTGTVASSVGNTLTATSKSNLHRKVTCTNTVSGLLDLTFNNISGTLDFGNGECDKNAVLTIAGKQYAVTLP